MLVSIQATRTLALLNQRISKTFLICNAIARFHMKAGFFLSTGSGHAFGYNCGVDFFLPEDHLQRMTPEETRITSLIAEPYPDGYRLRVNIEMTPFQKRPHLEVVLSDANNNEIASSSIVEALSWKIEFTMHIRGDLNNPYTLEARLYYPDGPATEPQTFTFDVKPPPSSEQPNSNST